ncbi:hypothetical protein B0X71_07935 [Planococcus lenghuensis]|uniref:Uncharacterized protein n=1 Tax=Planococcus lenghuensis TaxID=2213202 RepID=A0A1Q2KXT9_9BACL|nr:hypothetical protein B0X71_07935 [Planococcus lenghuensis]
MLILQIDCRNKHGFFFLPTGRIGWRKLLYSNPVQTKYVFLYFHIGHVKMNKGLYNYSFSEELHEQGTASY